MIVLVKPDATSNFTQEIVNMVNVENARGDSLNTQNLLAELIRGTQRLAAVYAKPDDTEPVLLLIYQEVQEIVRERTGLVINHIAIPSKEALMAYDSRADVREFHKFLEPFSMVLFITDNPSLVKVLARMGVQAKERFIMYNIVKETYEDGRN